MIIQGACHELVVGTGLSSLSDAKPDACVLIRRNGWLIYLERGCNA